MVVVDVIEGGSGELCHVVIIGNRSLRGGPPHTPVVSAADGTSGIDDGFGE